MIKTARAFTGFFFCLAILISCRSAQQLYRPGNKNQIYSGTLDEFKYYALRQLLATRTGSGLKDTVIIKYDYNNDGCWNSLDEKDKNYIQGFITRHQERVKKILAGRPNVSVFDFREPGHNINKIKKWDKSILTDSSKQLMKLIFKKRSACGNSIIVLPDKRFIFWRSDSHSEAMEISQNEILVYLTSK